MPIATATAAGMPQIAKLAKDGRERLLRHVRAEIAELEIELATLRDTERAMAGRAGASVAGARHRAGNGRKATSRASGRATSDEKILAAIGQRASQSSMIASKLRASQTSVLRRLRRLESEGKIVRVGQGRDTRWELRGKSAA